MWVCMMWLCLCVCVSIPHNGNAKIGQKAYLLYSIKNIHLIFFSPFDATKELFFFTFTGVELKRERGF